MNRTMREKGRLGGERRRFLPQPNAPLPRQAEPRQDLRQHLDLDLSQSVHFRRPATCGHRLVFHMARPSTVSSPVKTRKALSASQAIMYYPLLERIRRGGSVCYRLHTMLPSNAMWRGSQGAPWSFLTIASQFRSIPKIPYRTLLA